MALGGFIDQRERLHTDMLAMTVIGVPSIKHHKCMKMTSVKCLLAFLVLANADQLVQPAPQTQSGNVAAKRFSTDLKLVEKEYPGGCIDLSFVRCFVNGTCVAHKKIYIPPSPLLAGTSGTRGQASTMVNKGATKMRGRRIRRMIFLPDERRALSYKWTRYYPFNTVVSVKAEHGAVMKRCSGIALSNKMFLTAAHCVFTNTGELSKDVRVGVLHKPREMVWTKVVHINYHVNCTDSKKGGAINRFLDYALLETSKSLNVERMKVGFLRDVENKRINKYNRNKIISISAYDGNDPTILRYRSCRMVKTSRRYVYSRCDTVPESAGAGVYVVPQWGDRKIIAISSGDYGAGRKRKFSKALRITHMMFVQICHWLTGGFEKCGGYEI